MANGGRKSGIVIDPMKMFQRFLSLPVFLSLASTRFFLPSAIHSQEEAFQYQIISDPPGAAVFVGDSYKGVTPYTSAVVTGVPSVTYQVVAGGFEPVSVPVTGTPGRLTTANVTLTKAPSLTVDVANRLLEATRAELASAESEQAEIFAGFPGLTPYLTSDFKVRLQRMIRAATSLGATYSRLPSGTPFVPGSQVIWSVHEQLHEDADNISWMGSCIEEENGEYASGYGLIFAFSKEGDFWRLNETQEIGQDYGDEEEEN